MTVTFPKFSIKEMLEAGVHFGHKEMLWNPKMEPFIYGSRNGIHIIDLQKTVGLLFKALQILKAAGSNKKNKILFVGTKRQASDSIKEFALACGQHYVNHRWLGGMLTNWKTVSRSLKRLEDMEKMLEDDKNPDTPVKYNKKELLDIDRKRQKIEAYLGGIRNMGGRPDLLFVVDTNKEKIAIKEAEMLGIPVIAIVDTNSSLDGIDFPIPGNDDASRSIRFYCKLVSEAILSGAGEMRAKYETEDRIGTLDASLRAEESEQEGVKVDDNLSQETTVGVLEEKFAVKKEAEPKAKKSEGKASAKPDAKKVSTISKKK